MRRTTQAIPFLSRFPAVVLGALLPLACASTPPADAPESHAHGREHEHEHEPAAAPEPAEPVEASSVKASEPEDRSVPDDYQIVPGDCVQLGRQFGAATRADNVKRLDARLTPAQRASGEKSIEDAAAQLAQQWTQTCAASLVGKSADPKSLKCALQARSVEAFDVCLNGPPP